MGVVVGNLYERRAVQQTGLSFQRSVLLYATHTINQTETSESALAQRGPYLPEISFFFFCIGPDPETKFTTQCSALRL